MVFAKKASKTHYKKDKHQHRTYVLFMLCLKGDDKVIIAYYSMTGNIRRFLNSMDIPDTYELYQITAGNVRDKIDESFILVTPTYGYGAVPDTVKEFLQVNSYNLFAVASSGNRNWGQDFARAGEYISNDYSVPLLMKFELHGTPKERAQFIVELEKVGELHESIR